MWPEIICPSWHWLCKWYNYYLLRLFPVCTTPPLNRRGEAQGSYDRCCTNQTQALWACKVKVYSGLMSAGLIRLYSTLTGEEAVGLVTVAPQRRSNIPSYRFIQRWWRSSDAKTWWCTFIHIWNQAYVNRHSAQIQAAIYEMITVVQQSWSLRSQHAEGSTAGPATWHLLSSMYMLLEVMSIQLLSHVRRCKWK